MEVIQLCFAYTIILCIFKCIPSVQLFASKPVLIQPAEKIGTIDGICLGQYGLVSALSKRSREYSLCSAVGLWQVTYLLSVLSIFSFKVNTLVVVLPRKKVKTLRWADLGEKQIYVTINSKPDSVRSWALLFLIVEYSWLESEVKRN